MPTQSCKLAAKIVAGLLLPADFVTASQTGLGRPWSEVHGASAKMSLSLTEHRCHATTWRQGQLPVLSARVQPYKTVPSQWEFSSAPLTGLPLTEAAAGACAGPYADGHSQPLVPTLTAGR